MENRPVKAEMQFLWPPENETKVWSELHFTNILITNCLQIHHSLQADKMSTYCPVLKKEEKRKQAGKQKIFRPASLSISVSAHTTPWQQNCRKCHWDYFLNFAETFSIMSGTIFSMFHTGFQPHSARAQLSSI